MNEFNFIEKRMKKNEKEWKRIKKNESSALRRPFKKKVAKLLKGIKGLKQKKGMKKFLSLKKSAL